MDRKISTTFGIIVVAIIAGYFGMLFWWNYQNEKNMTYTVEQYTKPAEKNNLKEENVIDDTSDWKTYRNEKWGFEFSYPNNFIKNDNPKSDNDQIISVADFSIKPKVNVFNVYIVKNTNNKTLLDFAQEEIKENDCPAKIDDEAEAIGCPERGPADHIIKQTPSGVLYVTGHCGAFSEEYVYVAKLKDDSIIIFSSHDDFITNSCQGDKVKKLEKIISTFKFIN